MKHIRAFIDVECAKVIAVGGTGFGVQFANDINSWLKVAIGVGSFIYIVIKIWKELRR